MINFKSIDEMRGKVERKANFTVNEVNEKKGYVLIEDLGPWDKFKTVTNAAEWVVDAMFASGDLKEGQRLFYIDSCGDTDEIIIDGKRFAGFRKGQLP